MATWKKLVVESAAGKIAQEAATITSQGTLATLNTVATSQIASSAVTEIKLAANSVSNAKMKDDAIGINELSATGAASATTYLRGDNTWAVATAISTLNTLTDINITGTVADDEILAYNTGTAKWVNQTASEALGVSKTTLALLNGTDSTSSQGGIDSADSILMNVHDDFGAGSGEAKWTSITSIGTAIAETSSTFPLAGNLTVGGNMTVTGTTNLTGALTVNTDLTVKKSDGGTTFAVVRSNGNISTVGQASVGTTLSVGGTSTLTGNVDIAGTLDVAGEFTAAGTVTINSTTNTTTAKTLMLSSGATTPTAGNESGLTVETGGTNDPSLLWNNSATGSDEGNEWSITRSGYTAKAFIMAYDVAANYTAVTAISNPKTGQLALDQNTDSMYLYI
tara:strand:+ start:1121 stop:2305 length:1185 start_codon:yes stop_codon:yes gene_type:complete